MKHPQSPLPSVLLSVFLTSSLDCAVCPDSGDTCLTCTLTWLVMRNRGSRTALRKDTLTHSHIYSSHRLCVLAKRAAEIRVDFVEKPRILGFEAQRALLKRFFAHRKTSGQKGSIPRCYQAFSTS